MRPSRIALLLALLVCAPASAQTAVFTSGWETGTGTASSCVGDAADVLTDGGLWQDYGPGTNAICDATPDLAQISTSVVHSGSRALQMHFKDNDGNNGPDVRIIRNFGTNYSDLYIRYYIRWSSDFVWASADHKMIILGTGNQNSQDVYLNTRADGASHTTARLALYNTHADTFWEDTVDGDGIALDTWHLVELHIVSGSGTGSLEVKFNGTLMSNWVRVAGSGPSTPTGLTVDTIGYVKLDNTYNCFQVTSTNCGGDPNNFMFYNTTGQADVFYDDVQVCQTTWCGATGSSGNFTRVPFLRR